MQPSKEGAAAQLFPSKQEFMTNIVQSIRRFQGRSLALLRDTRGLSTVEYVIILVLIAVLAIGTWRTFGNAVKKQITDSSTSVEKLREDDGKSKGD